MLKAIPRQSLELSWQEFGEVAKAFLDAPGAVGEGVREFEEAVARLVGAGHAVSFSSQRAGMYAALEMIAARRRGDEIIVPAYTFFSVPACVVLTEFTPVFVDVDPLTWNLDPEKVKAAVTARTRALLVTHLNGCPAQIEPLAEIAKQHGLLLIEDGAQAFGAAYQSRPVGSWGVGCFSFGEGKNVYTLGGGVVTTNDAHLAKRLREARDAFRAPGRSRLLLKVTKAIAWKALSTPSLFTLTAFPWLYLQALGDGDVDPDREHTLRHAAKYFSEQALRTPLTNVQALLGLAQLKALERRNQKRIDNARCLSEALQGIEGITLPPAPTDRTHLYLHYAVRVRDREHFVRSLIRRGVDAQRDYCSFCPGLSDFKRYRQSAPFAESLGGEVVYLPNHPGLGKSDMLRIAREVKKVLAL